MEKQGFDIDNCMCESCRDGIAVKQSKTLTSRDYSSLYKIATILFTISLIAFIVWVLDGVACIEDSSTCSSNPISLSLFLSLIFFYSGIFYFIKGLSAQKRNKQNLK